MDNLCHTLAGAALGQAGLKRRTALGMATLLIGANLPDVDVIAVPLGHSLEFRRGWTHGVPALVVLPLLLTALVLGWDRWVRRRGARASLPPARPREVLLLAALSVLSHPFLDFLNTYGMRWLMPLDGTWFYGDALFIIDPWVWAALAIGVWASRGARPRPARWALGAVGVYIALMLASAAAGRGMVARELARRGLPPARSIMAGPVPLDPLRREVVVEYPDHFRFGAIRWLPRPHLELWEQQLPRNTADPAAAMAASEPEARAFLSWSRYPFFIVERRPGLVRVRLDDARYTNGPAPSWAAVTVTIPTSMAGE